MEEHPEQEKSQNGTAEEGQSVTSRAQDPDPDVEAGESIQQEASKKLSTRRRFTSIRDKVRQKHHRTRYVTPAENVNPRGHNLLKAILFELFVTRSMAPKGDRELYVKYSIRQFFIFVYFLMSLSVVAYANTSPFAYVFQKSLSDLLIDDRIDSRSWHSKTFRTIGFVEDVWTYLQHGLPHNLYWEYFYTPDSDALEYELKLIAEPSVSGIFYENELVGVPRLRQIRVEQDNCPLADAFRHLSRRCYPSYSQDVEDHGNNTNYWYIEKYHDQSAHTFPKFEEAWHYRNGSELEASWYWGEIFTYSGNGAVQNLAKTRNETLSIIRALKDHIWLQKSTSALFLDFTVYNANVDLFCVVRLLFEFPATGGVTTAYSIDPIHILHYDNWYEAWVVGPSEVVIGIFSVYYLLQEILEMQSAGSHDYVRNIWSWLGIFIILSSWITLSVRIYLAFLTDSTFHRLNRKEVSYEYHSFEFLAYWQNFHNETLSVCSILSWLKLFKYIAFNKTMVKLCGTLNRCSQDIAGFAIMFFVVFIAFVQLGYLQFGAQVKDFRSFEDSTFTLLRLILGDFDFHGLETASPYIGPLFFVLYIFFIFFVLLNMFLAIMNDTYSEVKAEIQAQRFEFEIADYIIRGFNNFLALFGRRSTKLDAENAVKLAAADGQLTFDEIRKTLQRADFKDVEIEIFLARYDVNKDHPCLDEEEAQWRLEALQEKHANEVVETNPVKKPEPEMSQSGLSVKVQTFKSTGRLENEQCSIEEKFEELETRVTTLEFSLGKLILKLNSVVDLL